MNGTKYAAYMAPPQQPVFLWKAALYIRLSRDDGDKMESNSVTSQREILKEWLKLHPDIALNDFYVDDGWSGTNFDRPGFQRMMDDIYSGNVNCVIVKDLSRFCRNASEGGRYLDDVFVRLRVRFIALNNGIDTASGTMNAATQLISVGVTNVINESVAATTSVNVRGTLNMNRQQGKFIGSFPTYGYLKDPENRHKLIVDEETAPVVRMIFDKFLSGTSIMGIAKELNAMGIPNPSAYKKLKGCNYRHPAGKKNDGLWPDSSVRRILRNEMYIGNMVQGKNTTVSYKIHQCRAVPKENWIRVTGTHQAIIDPDTFANVQALLGKHIRKPPAQNQVHLLAGLVRCAKCGRIMSRKTNRHTYGTYHYYRCVTNNKMQPGGCTRGSLRVDRIENAVLTLLQATVAACVEYEKLLVQINSSSNRKTKSDSLQRLLAQQRAEREKCLRAMADLYPDWKSGILTQQEYLNIKVNLNEKLERLDESLQSLESTAKQYAQGMNQENAFLSSFRKYGNITELTRPMLVELVKEIRVYDQNRIEVELNFRDEYEQLVEYLEMNRDAVGMVYSN
ncbi:MAG: recombinase family protein [Oscillospiraceae bacterium]|nr:recombinase family protein [Oscillospiraceae bacterium]